MRSEKEMLELIVRTAQEDSRIRAAYLEGSRVCPSAVRDIFQDYDVVYIVGETRSFREDRQWIDRFGRRLYMQYPEDSVYEPSDVESCYGWLLQLADGNRLDLHVCTPSYALPRLELYRVLVDKDQLLPAVENRSEKRYWVCRPSQKQFDCTCNEFWWCLNNVAKGLWRGELPYVMDMLDFNVRPQLRRLLEWKAGADNGFSVAVGKCGKYLSRYLPPALYSAYLGSYTAAEAGALWEAVLGMCGLFHTLAQELSQRLGLSYDCREATASRSHLEHVRLLPPDAAEIYEDLPCSRSSEELI